MSASNGKTGGYEADLLLVLPVCLAQGSAGLLFEHQAANGIEQWLESFSRIQVICPLLTADEARRQSHSIVWKQVSEIAGADRVKFIPVPYATSLASFTRAFARGRMAIRRAIKQSRYLCFAIGGLFGDWGAMACLEARRLNRPYAVWTDRVEHKVGLLTAANKNRLKRIKADVRSRLMYRLERRCIRNSSLGLFHGASCYSEYAFWCRTPYLVQDYPLPELDAIGAERLAEKVDGVMQSEQLTIAYVGRADEMKGPLDWLDVMEELHERGISYQATWLGDGPLLAEMRDRVARRGMEHIVLLPGFVADRSEVFGLLRRSHMFVFCHKTPESPRCLVEALVSACPIVGYASDYATELTEDGGGISVAVGDKEGLVESICALDSNRQKLVALKTAAVPAGKRVLELADFRYRSNLIKAHL